MEDGYRMNEKGQKCLLGVLDIHLLVEHIITGAAISGHRESAGSLAEGPSTRKCR